MHKAAPLPRRIPWLPLLGALLPALAFASFILYISLDHNPQGEFYGSEEGTQWGHILALFASAFGLALVCVGVPVALLVWLVRRARRRRGESDARGTAHPPL